MDAHSPTSLSRDALRTGGLAGPLLDPFPLPLSPRLLPSPLPSPTASFLSLFCSGIVDPEVKIRSAGIRAEAVEVEVEIMLGFEVEIALCTGAAAGVLRRKGEGSCGEG